MGRIATNTVAMTPPKPAANRPLLCQAVYGRPGGYVGGAKRRPRREWQVTRDTHFALITEAAAEAILGRLEAKAWLRARTGDRIYLLAGLLLDTAGQPMSGETNKGQRAYRAAGRGGRISARLIERAVLDRLFADLAAPDIAQEIAARMRQSAAPTGRPRDLAALRRRLAALEGKIARLVDLIANAGEAAPAYRRAIASAEQDRAALVAEIEQAETDSRQATIIRAWTVADVTRLLATLRATLETDLAEERIQAVRETLAGLVDKISLDLKSRTYEIHYRLHTGINVASPRGCCVNPVCWIGHGTVARRVA